MKSLFTPSLFNLSISYPIYTVYNLSICIPPSRNPPSRLLRQFEFLNMKNSSALKNSKISKKAIPPPNQTPPSAPTKPLLIPDVANWLNFCCTTLGGGQKKWYIPDIFLNVYTLTFIIIYKKGAFLVAWFFSSSADFVHTERAETFCPEFAVLLPGSRADWCQKAEFRAVGPKSGPVKYLAV